MGGISDRDGEEEVQLVVFCCNREKISHHLLEKVL